MITQLLYDLLKYVTDFWVEVLLFIFVVALIVYLIIKLIDRKVLKNLRKNYKESDDLGLRASSKPPEKINDGMRNDIKPFLDKDQKEYLEQCFRLNINDNIKFGN
jgi:hypothetical protein